MDFKHYIVYEPVREFRLVALQALKGHWKTVLIIGFVYYLCLNLPVVVIDFLLGSLQSAQAALTALLEGMPASEWAEKYGNSYNTVSNISTLYSILVTGVFVLGTTMVWLNVLRSRPIDFEMLFDGFSNFLRALSLHIFKSVFIILWSLLFIVPGIVAYYRYSMAFYLLADNPKMSAMEALRLSSIMMRGNKLKLFTLDLSFIGWLILAGLVNMAIYSIALVFGTAESEIGTLFQVAWQTISSAVASVFWLCYRNVAFAEFYRRISAPYIVRQNQQTPTYYS